MIPPTPFSITFNHPANVCAAALALASEDEAFPYYFRRLQDNRYGPGHLPQKTLSRIFFCAHWGIVFQRRAASGVNGSVGWIGIVICSLVHSQDSGLLQSRKHHSVAEAESQRIGHPPQKRCVI